MIKVDIPIIVEGKYDKIKLSSVVDGMIFETGGFRIFKDNKLKEFIKTNACGKGIIVITDSDRAGEKIRGHIKSIAGQGAKIHNVYLPQICGKERRKEKASADGFLGVEGIDNKIIEQALTRFCAINDKTSKEKITVAMLFDYGFSGRENSALMRKRLLKRLNLPDNINTNSLLKILNTTMDFSEAERILKEEGAKWD